MPEPNLNDVAPRGVVDLSDAPVAITDESFDSLFPAEPAAPAVAPQGATPKNNQGAQPSPSNPPAPASPTTQPSPAVADEPFLKGASTVYKTKEAALDGINQKDAVIEQLRSRIVMATGIDPLTGRPAAQPVNQPVEVDYSREPQRYVEDLYKAAKSGDPNAYAAVQQKFMADSQKPQQAMFQQFVKHNAITTVGNEIQGFDKFYGGAEYNKALDSMPILKDAITQAETNTNYNEQLPQLYKIAYLVSRGVQMPDLLKANANANQPNQNPTPARPTATPSTPSVPVQTVKPSLRTVDGIKAIIADAEARGVKLDF